MAVDFCDYFWGEKHEGFHVLYSNLKAGFMATKDLSDVIRETALIQENSHKSYAKISKQLGTSVQLGTFSPILLALKTASDKLSAIHLGTQTKVNELLKELEKYSVELHKKQKMIKDEESPTSDIVKALQDTTVNLQKSKEFYKVKAAELEKLKRESPSPKELEKAETKFRKAQEDYKTLCDKYSNIREDFEKKMTSSCKHFQQSETIFLTQMVDFVHSYHELLDINTNEVGKVNLELEENLVVNTVEKMLEQFVLQKYTGLVKPGPMEFEAENISLTSLNATNAIPGGPPSDISDRSANSDKVAAGEKVSVVKKESTGKESALERHSSSLFLPTRTERHQRGQLGPGAAVRVRSWGPAPGQQTVKCDPGQGQFQPQRRQEKKTSSQPRCSFPKTTRQSLLGSGLKATSLLNIFMHTQPEASEVKTPEARPGTEQTVKKGLELEQIDVVFPLTQRALAGQIPR